MSDQAKRFRVRSGGLYRCCYLTLDKRESEERECVEGEELACQYCGCPMRFRDGAWEWAISPFKAQQSRPQ